MTGFIVTINGTEIADDDPRGVGVVETWEPDGQRAVQPSVTIGGAYPRYFDRLTVSERIRFAVFCEQGSLADAHTFAMLQRRALPGVAEVIFSFTDEDGTEWVATCADAEVQVRGPEVTGRGTLTTYEIGLGAVTVTEDDEEVEYLAGGGYDGVFAGADYVDGGSY